MFTKCVLNKLCNQLTGNFQVAVSGVIKQSSSSSASQVLPLKDNKDKDAEFKMQEGCNSVLSWCTANKLSCQGKVGLSLSLSLSQ